MMVAIPVALIVQRHDKQIGALQLLQNKLAVAPRGLTTVRHVTLSRLRGSHAQSFSASRHGITQRAAHAVEDGGLEQEGLDVGRLGREHLGRQIIHDIAVAAA